MGRAASSRSCSHARSLGAYESLWRAEAEARSRAARAAARAVAGALEEACALEDAMSAWTEPASVMEVLPGLVFVCVTSDREIGEQPSRLEETILLFYSKIFRRV